MTHGRVVAVFFRGLSRDVEAEASGAAGPEDRLRDPSKVIIASPEFGFGEFAASSGET
jgi:hypothetical protein